jgi:3-mercaptopyruvate sulfurtransferase SseA
MKTVFAVAILLGATFVAAPALRAQEDAFGDPALAAAAAAPVQTVSPAEVMKMMQDSSAKFALVDTQPVDGYADTHIPGAINYPWVMQIKKFPINLPRDRALIFYGSCHNDTSSMVSKLAEFGYTNVKIMDGGLEKWLELKYPATRRANAPAEQSLSQLTAAPHNNDKPVTAAK